MNAPETTLPILLREDSAGVATLTLNRPAQFNSLSEELLAELQATLNAIATDASVRAVVIATTHVPVPVQAPLQPENVEPTAGVAVSVTLVPWL